MEEQKTRKEETSRIADVVNSYCHDQMGMSPKKISVDIHDQLITVTLEGVSHPAELNLAKEQLSRSMLQKIYSELFDVSKSILHSSVHRIMDKTVIHSFFTVDPKYGNAVIVLFLEKI